jgi:hypothetical protein
MPVPTATALAAARVVHRHLLETKRRLGLATPVPSVGQLAAGILAKTMTPAPAPPPPSNPLLEQARRTQRQMLAIKDQLGLAIAVPSLEAIAGELRVEQAGQALLEANGPDYGPASVRLLEAFLGQQGPGRRVPLTEVTASGVDEAGRQWVDVEVLEVEGP